MLPATGARFRGPRRRLAWIARRFRRAALRQTCGAWVSRQIMGRVKVSHSSAMLGIHRRCPWLAPRGQCPAEGVIVGRPRSAFLLRAIAATHGAWQGGAARVSAGEARGALNHGRKTLAASRRGWHRSAFESRPGKPARHGDRVAVRAIVMQQRPLDRCSSRSPSPRGRPSPLGSRGEVCARKTTSSQAASMTRST